MDNSLPLGEGVGGCPDMEGTSNVENNKQMGNQPEEAVYTGKRGGGGVLVRKRRLDQNQMKSDEGGST